MGILDGLNLPTLADVNARPRACPKGASRLERDMDKAKDDKKAEAAFLRAVHQRDGKVCRCCGVVVVGTIQRLPNQRQVHHIYGRLGAFRFDPRHAIQTCRLCHERITGTIGSSRLFLFQRASYMVKVGGKSLIDASKPVEFKEKSA